VKKLIAVLPRPPRRTPRKPRSYLSRPGLARNVFSCLPGGGRTLPGNGATCQTGILL